MYVISLSRYLAAFLVAMFALAVGASPALAHGSGSSGSSSGPPTTMALDFAVLSSEAAVTCTNATITGNVGALAAVTQTTCSVSGTVTTPISAAVSADFEAKYAALGAATCDPLNTNIPLAGATLVPGVSCFDSFVALTDTTLTLDGPADGIWIFKVGTLGTGYLEATNLSVVMANGAQACNVSWWVAAYATLTGNTAGAANFSGNILAGAAITSTDGTFAGSALARAAVTLTRTDLTGCATVAVPGHGHGDKDDDGDNDDDDKDKGDEDKRDKGHGDKDRGDKDRDSKSGDKAGSSKKGGSSSIGNNHGTGSKSHN